MTTDQQVNTQAQAAEPSQQSNNSFVVPEAYQGKGWVEKIKSPDDLWKTLDNTQSLLGKRPAGIPTADAPKEEWDKFYQAARPESPDKYTLPEIEGLPEGVDLSAQKKTAMELMYKAGLTNKQAADLWKEFMGTELKAAGENKAAYEAKQKELDAEFDKLTKEVFGGDFENVSKSAINFANEIVPESLRDAPAAIADNPKALAYIAALAKGAQDKIAAIQKEYGAEGTITSGNQAASVSIDDVRKELAALRTSKAARDPFSPEYKKTLDRIQELSGTVERHYKKA